MTSLCAVLTAGPSPLSAMLYALAPPGTPSGQHIGLDGVSLGFVQEAGGRSSGLWTDPASGWTWTGNARLDNREDLRDALHLPANVPDAALAYHAFLRFETNALARIQGDWQFVAWNSRQRKMVVARDPFGMADLYYHQSPDRFACSSLINAVLTLPDLSRQPHWEHLVLSLSHLPAPADSTAYRYVRRLPPGHALLLTAKNCQLLPYSKIDGHLPLAPGSVDDHQLQFESSFRLAVESRIRSVLRPATTLSGGFNSAALTATAARLLYPSGENLVAFAVAPNLTPRLTSLAKWHGNLHVRLVSASLQCPVAAWRSAVVITGSPDCHSHPPWQLPLLAEAQALGHSALLIGQGGGATLAWNGRSPWWRSSWFPSPGSSGPDSLLRPSFVQDHGFAELIRHTRRSLAADPHSRVALLHRNDPFHWSALAGAHGIQIIDPTLDAAFIHTCLSLPPQRFRNRRPLRRAMEGLLPDSIRLHPNHDAISIFLPTLANAQAAIESFADQGAITELLDLPRLQQTLQRLIQSPSQSDYRMVASAFSHAFFIRSAAEPRHNLVNRSAA